MTDPDQQSKEATRQRLIEAAIEVFATKGYHGAAVDDIIRVSDTSKGTFYFHFPNKHGVFLVLIDALAGLLERDVEAAIGDESGGLAKVDAALRAVIGTLARHRKLAKILLVEAVGVGPGLDEKLLQIHERFANLIKSHLERAIAEGSAAPVDAELAAYAWLGAVNEILIRWLYTGKPDPLEAAIPELRNLLLRSVGARSLGRGAVPTPVVAT
ncbi:MAG: TetR/AcrR family transcriptional regulator [Chloroflexi bacterium]|nr:TetR/AcrR family transcriptional regulator [Chloroflexota bacterium]